MKDGSVGWMDGRGSGRRMKPLLGGTIVDRGTKLSEGTKEATERKIERECRGVGFGKDQNRKVIALGTEGKATWCVRLLCDGETDGNIE